MDQKEQQEFFGYKNHISVDVKHKLIRKFQVTSAKVHDSRVVEELLDANNSSRALWADSAYRSEDRLLWLREQAIGNIYKARGRGIILFPPGSFRATEPAPAFAAGLSMFLA